MTDILEFLMGLKENAKGTFFEPYVIPIFGCVSAISVFNLILIPVGKGIKKFYNYISQNRFIKNKVYINLDFIESADVYYAINRFIPTRFSAKNDPGNDDEPTPIYTSFENEKDPLLIEHFIKFEFEVSGGKKYYFCLADCGMGKTTFLINLYYRMLKQGKYKCRLVGLQDPSCLDIIDEISEKGKTILLLDALDENDSALTDYSNFIEKLEQKTRTFYRVIITSRTNFFESESKERLSGKHRICGIASKLPELRKYYITPFTDEDIQRYLNMRYRFKRKKKEQALEIINRSKNLSVRPMLLRFMDELLLDNQTFEYDFQLYECLFQKWIAREIHNDNDEDGKKLYNECLSMAKAIYCQWMKNGRIGIFISELPENDSVPGLQSIQLKGHALLNRTSAGLYKFSHKSYWEYMLAKLALSDIYFSDRILIMNFDRAASFFDEMISYYHSHEEEQTPEIAIGIANYLMKYHMLEDAERQYNKAISLCDGQKELQLVSKIQLAKCFQRQLKYKSAEKILQECQTLIEQIPLDKKSLSLYVQFGSVYSEYCNMNHLNDGQNFLQNIITFCNLNNFHGYDLLYCYKLYCECCVNYCFYQKALSEMKQLIKEYFQNDQYATYLWNRAQSSKMNYDNHKFIETLINAISSDKRFMDSYELMCWYCDLGVFSSAEGGEWSNIEKWIDDAYKIAYEIYSFEEYKELNNPYAVKVLLKAEIACSVYEAGNMEWHKDTEMGYISSIFQYMEQQHMQEEMAIIQYNLFEHIQKNLLVSFDDMERIAIQCYETAEADSSAYYLIEACWGLFLLYSSNEQTEILGQKYLKQAYEKAQDNQEYRLTNRYCELLQVIYGYYEEESIRAVIVQELITIMPHNYGNDTRRFSICSMLQKYFSEQNDMREIEMNIELLYCKFDFHGLTRFYESCNKYQQIENFLTKLNQICLKKRILSNDEISELKRFKVYIVDLKNELASANIELLEAIIERSQSLLMEAV